jgi:hypothetical protein
MVLQETSFFHIHSLYHLVSIYNPYMPLIKAGALYLSEVAALDGWEPEIVTFNLKLTWSFFGTFSQKVYSA